MKVECVKNKLQQVVSLVEKVTGRKLALTILSKIIFETKSKDFFAKATNLDIAVEIKIPAKVSMEGVIAIDGSVLEAHLANLPESSVFLETTAESLIIKTSNSSARISVYESDDYPMFSREKKINGSMVCVEATDLALAIRSVSYASSTSDIKPELASILMSFFDEELIFVATDSFRLALKKIPVIGHSKIKISEFSALIPFRSVIEIGRIFENYEGEVEITYSSDEIIFKTDSIFVTARLVNGNFPPYEGIIPKSTTTQVVVSRDDLVSAIRLATVFSDKFYQVSLRVIPEDYLFEVGGKAQEKGEGTVRVNVTTTGLSVDTRVNAKYFLDCLGVLKGGDITIGFNGTDKAMTVRHSGDRSFLYLLMPLNK
ncbi:MAG TPA: DNA polymerase III subunit beta [Candidatus Paceibacterota bacterium]